MWKAYPRWRSVSGSKNYTKRSRRRCPIGRKRNSSSKNESLRANPAEQRSTYERRWQCCHLRFTFILFREILLPFSCDSVHVILVNFHRSASADDACDKNRRAYQHKDFPYHISLLLCKHYNIQKNPQSLSPFERQLKSLSICFLKF